jgi:hypothetical protein
MDRSVMTVKYVVGDPFATPNKNESKDNTTYEQPTEQSKYAVERELVIRLLELLGGHIDRHDARWWKEVMKCRWV